MGRPFSIFDGENQSFLFVPLYGDFRWLKSQLFLTKHLRFVSSHILSSSLWPLSPLAMSSLSMWALLSLAGVGYAQQPGTMKTEGNPTISVTKWALSQHFQYNLKSQSCQSLMMIRWSGDPTFKGKNQHRISSLLVFFLGIFTRSQRWDHWGPHWGEGMRAKRLHQQGS